MCGKHKVRKWNDEQTQHLIGDEVRAGRVDTETSGCVSTEEKKNSYMEQTTLSKAQVVHECEDIKQILRQLQSKSSRCSSERPVRIGLQCKSPQSPPRSLTKNCCTLSPCENGMTHFL